MKGVHMKYIIFLILGLILLLISFLTRESDTSNIINQKAVGTIEKIIYSDSGNVRYYVKFSANGLDIQGQSIHYYSTNRKYHEGDTVNISYHYSKNGKAIVEVEDDELIPCKNSLSKFSKGSLVIGIILIVVFVILFVKTLLKA